MNEDSQKIYSAFALLFIQGLIISASHVVLKYSAVH